MAKKVDDIIDKYEKKLEDQYGEDYIAEFEPEIMNKEYELFRSEILETKVTNYERWCEIEQTC